MEGMDGKAMVVCMSRRICIDLYRELVRLRPDWYHPDDAKGGLKVVMTGGAADPADWQPHIRSKRRRRRGRPLPRRRRPAAHGTGARHVAHRFRCAEPTHHVRDKPMRGHGLMQAIAVSTACSGQTGRSGGRLTGACPRAQAGPCHLHREWRHRPHRAGPERGGGGDAGEVRDLLRPAPRVRPIPVVGRYPRGTFEPAARCTGTCASAGKREGTLPAGGACPPQAFALAVPTSKRCASVTTWSSSRASSQPWPSARRPRRGRTKNSIMPCGKSSRVRWPRRE